MLENPIYDDYVVISTIHSAKGLEWPIVHLPHVVDGAIPSDMALKHLDGLEEERRLFYVAVTRARDAFTSTLRSGCLITAMRATIGTASHR